MVEALPSASVHLTPSDRNDVYLAHVTLPDGRAYPMYFGLRRAPADQRQHLLMVVESAYPVADRKRVLAGTAKISFPVLCAKVYSLVPHRLFPKAGNHLSGRCSIAARRFGLGHAAEP